MRVSIAQINSAAGDFRVNSAKMLQFAERAWEDEADIVLFPEMSIPGWPLMDLLGQDYFVDLNARVIDFFKEKLPDDIAVGLGYVARNTRPGEKGLLNVYGIIHDGELVFEQARALYPPDGTFGEGQYFEGAHEWPVFELFREKIGFAVSESTLLEYAREDSRAESAPGKLAAQGISLLCVPTASPFVAGNFKNRTALAGRFVEEEKIPIVCVNAAGANGEVIFDGRSLAIAPLSDEAEASGKRPKVFCAKAFEEDILVWETGGFLPDDKEAAAVFPLELPGENSTQSTPRPAPTRLIRNKDPFGVGLSRPELDELSCALVTGIREYMEKCGFEQAHLGLSGGIDSSLVACLAVEAAGPENVTCFSMPSRFSSPGSKDDAREQAENLGCRFETLPIEDCYAAFLSTLEGVFEGRPFDVTEENLQPRIRGTLLMAYSNKYNSMLLSPGNKSEIAMGYCTLYGDMCGALAPIGDLFKTEVFALCKRLNERSIGESGMEIIPRAIIDKPPSAELRPGQKDEDSLPPYPALDAILKSYLHDGLDAAALAARSGDKELVRRVLKAVARSDFKRRQAAPILRVSKRPFGLERKIPLARVMHEV